jgi:hypothetical protein
MAFSVICHSCGHRVELPEDFTRRKVRCPECGVMCEVTEATRSSPQRPSKQREETAPQDAEELARQLWSEPEPPKKKERPAAKATPQPQEEPAGTDEAPLRMEEPVVTPRQAAVTWTEEDEDNSRYEVSGGLPITCPQCHRELPAGTVLCVGCGWDLKTGKKKAALQYEPFQRYWEPWLSYEGRLNLFLAATLISFILSIIGAILADSWYFTLGPWVGFVATVAFLLGTFNRVDLARDRRGNARLTQTWRVFFVLRPTQTIDLREYDGVVTGRSLDAGCYEWLIMFILLAYFVVPGLLWWHYIIRKSKYHVALARSHGYAEIMLYRGNSQETAEEIAEALRDAAHLRYDRG